MSKARLRRLREADEFAIGSSEKETEEKTEEKKPARRTEKKGDDDMAFSLSSFKGLFSSKKAFAVISIIILLAISFGASWYFRGQTANLPQTKDWATQNVASYYKDAIRQQVNKQYPNLPTNSKEQIINTEYQKFYAGNKATINRNVEELQKLMKRNFQDDSGHTYILNIDSFFFLRKARNIVEKGHYYDELVDGVPKDALMFAPKGITADDDFHSEFAAYLFMAVRIFDPGATLPHVAFWVTPLLASLCVIPIFFIVRRKAGNFAGFFASLIFAIHPAFLGRSMAGDFDNDVQNIFFPLIITWLLLEMLETKSTRRKFLYTGLIGIFMGLSSFAWRGGWWYMFDFILGVFFVYLWYQLIKIITNKAVKKKWYSPLWTRALIFFVPLIILAMLFFVWRLGFFIVFGIYAILLLAYFFHILVGGIIQRIKRQKVEHPEFQTTFALLITYIIVCGVFVTLFLSFNAFVRSPTAPIRITQIQEAAMKNYWPNVYTTVAELNVTDFSGVISNIGAFGGITSQFNFFFILAVMGVVLCLVKEKMRFRDYFLLAFSLVFYIIITRPSLLTMPKFQYLALFIIPFAIGLFFLLDDDTVDIQFAVFLVLWFIATIYAGTQGIRFIHILVPAFSVAIGVAIGKIYRSLSGLLRKELKINAIISKGVILLLLLFFLVNPLKAAADISKNNVPIFDRTWYEALDAVKADSQPNAIINSWWDFGHFFKWEANRQVTFDGAIQNTPPAHWIGRALATSDETEVIGILRMLDCGQENGYTFLVAELNDDLKAINLLKREIVLPKEEARTLLKSSGIPESSTDKILGATHCDPPEDYFITSGDMVGKAGVWAHFGYWDFNKAFIYINTKGKSRDEAVSFLESSLNMTPDQAEQAYLEPVSLTTDREVNSWISPWPGYVTTSTLGCTRLNATIDCRVNLGLAQNAQTTTVLEKVSIDLENPENSSITISAFDKTLSSRLGSQVDHPKHFVITGKDGFTKIAYDNATFPYDIVIDTYKLRLLIADPTLSTSTFTKLFFLDGIYMEHFDKLFEGRSQTQGNVIVWKVDWNGKSGDDLVKMRQQWGMVSLNGTAPTNGTG